MEIFTKPLSRLNIATTIHGIAGGFFLTHISLTLNKNSLLLAAFFNAFYALGSALSWLPKKLKPKTINTLTLLLRFFIFTLVVEFSSKWLLPLLFFLGLILASLSRRQFIDLKQGVGAVDVRFLTAHGSFNAIGYGLGAAVSGLLLGYNYLLFGVGILTFVLSFLFYPVNSTNTRKNNALGLTKRDIAVAILFTASITPLGNAVGLLVFSNIYGDEVAGLTVFAYTLGSLLSQKIADKLRERQRPIAKSVFVSSLFLTISLLYHSSPLLLVLRFTTGAMLYAAQGLLEERTHKETESRRGLDYLWSIFSLTSFTLLLVLPGLGERFGFIILPIYSMFLAVFIAYLRKFIP